ncbi:MAG TPA: transglutaminaseTgpA domain-containing protein, partial [Streptosporangiaceae bacterium]
LVSLWRSAPRYGRAPGGTFDGAESDGRGLDGRGLDRRGLDRRGERRPGPDTRALAAAGRRVGLASIVLALCAPLIVPGLHASKLFSSGPGIGGTGGNAGGQSLTLPSALNQAVAQLHESQPRPLFTYSTNASQSQQSSDAEYFRQYVFDSLGDKGWKVDNWAARSVPVSSMPGPTGLSGLAAPQTVRTIVRTGKDLRSPGTQPTFLPLPYPAIQVTAPGKWLVDPDRMVYSTSDSITDQTYSATSVVVNPSQAQLQAVPGLVRSAELAPDLQLPSAYRTSALKKLAASNTAGQTTEFAKVNALATWLSGPQFTYSLAPAQPTSAPSLVNFLTKGRSGYCVHYAYAMTVLTRLLGIPARFVVGYTAGTRQKDGSYVVSTTDSHAWTEVYFPSMGWIRFEPTPAGQGTANTPDYMTGGAGNGQGAGAPPAISATENPSALKTPPPVGGLGVKTIRPGDTAGGLVGPAKRAGTPWTAVALAVIAALVLALGLISVVAGPSQHLLAGHLGVLRRPRTATVAIVGVAAAALVALALYRLLARTSGLNLGVGWATVGIAFGATAAVALVTPAVFRLVLRRWRWMRADDDAGRAHAAWREFHDDLADFGVTSRPSEPPRTLAARVTTTLAEPAAEAVTRLALAEERASYAARPTGSQNLRRDGTAARRGLAANARRSTRWRATVFPASMMTALGEGAARIPDRITTLRFRRRTR